VHFHIADVQAKDIQRICSEHGRAYLEYVYTLASRADAQTFLSSHQLTKNEPTQLETRWRTAQTNLGQRDVGLPSNGNRLK
jgi:hypothetical protein